MKDTLELLERLIADTEFVMIHSVDEMDKEVQQAILDVLVATWFMSKSKLW